MSYIHLLPDWPRFSWDNEALVQPLGALRHRQGRHTGRLLGLGFELVSEANLSALTEEVVKTSAIEGELLDRGEVRSSIGRRLGLDVAGLPEPGRQVEGVVELMLDATQGFEAPLTDERLFGWHAALFPTGRSGTVKITVGAWRTGPDPMQVVSGPIGRQRVHFEAPSAERVDNEMSQFLGWFSSPPSMDPVIRAAVAHLWFLTVHPFDDGNGRIARAITEMVLAQADGSEQRFYSMSSGIDARRNDYYRILETSQRGGLDITPWLLWFVDCLDQSIESAEATLGTVLHKANVWAAINPHPVNERQRKVINRLLDRFEGNLTTSKYAKLARCSTDTALRDIRELIELGILSKNPGRGRSTSYRLVGPGGTS